MTEQRASGTEYDRFESALKKVFAAPKEVSKKRQAKPKKKQ
jgi:hypothetical protein